MKFVGICGHHLLYFDIFKYLLNNIKGIKT